MTVQTIKTEGQAELVVITRQEYDGLVGRHDLDGKVLIAETELKSLRARAGIADDEDDEADRLIREARRARETEGDRGLPEWLSLAILKGDTPLRAARRRAGLTQVLLAGVFEMSQGHYSDIESGRRPLPPHLGERIAKQLGVEPEWLLD